MWMLASLLSLAVLLTQCQPEEQSSKNIGESQGVEEIQQEQKSVNIENVGEDNNDSAANSETSATSDEGTPKPVALFDSEKYFNEVVVPLLEDGCSSCHAGPFIPVSQNAPLSIFEFAQMSTWLGDGPGDLDNALIKKVQNIVSHQGGDRCQGNVDQEPCRTFAEWWRLLNGYSGENEGAAQGNQTGVVAQYIGTLWSGEVYGYAYNTENLQENLAVALYVGESAENGGRLIDTILANKNGFDGNVEGEHRFSYTISPADFTSGEKLRLFAYALQGEEKHLIGGAAKEFYVYSPSALQFFQDTVDPAMEATCEGCHPKRSFSDAFGRMILPPPAEGGSATTNSLYEKISGVKMHRGPESCDNNPVCDALVTWYNLEFN